MKVCTNCHLSFPDSASHCTQCGAPLTTVADQPPVYSGDPLDHTAEFDPADISANKVFALIPYLMGWVGVIITLLAFTVCRFSCAPGTEDSNRRAAFARARYHPIPRVGRCLCL